MDFVYKHISETMLVDIVELFIESFNSAPWNDNWTPKTAYKRLCTLMHTDGFLGLSAYQNDEMCGFVMGIFEQYCDEVEFSIREFAVKNTGRGQGLGSQLFMELEKYLREMGVKRITLLTLKGNLTERFYEKNGFQINSQIACMNKIVR